MWTNSWIQRLKKYVHIFGKCVARLLGTSEYLGQNKIQLQNRTYDYDLPI